MQAEWGRWKENSKEDLTAEKGKASKKGATSKGGPFPETDADPAGWDEPAAPLDVPFSGLPDPQQVLRCWASREHASAMQVLRGSQSTKNQLLAGQAEAWVMVSLLEGLLQGGHWLGWGWARAGGLHLLGVGWGRGLWQWCRSKKKTKR